MTSAITMLKTCTEICYYYNNVKNMYRNILLVLSPKFSNPAVGVGVSVPQKTRTPHP